MHGERNAERGQLSLPDVIVEIDGEILDVGVRAHQNVAEVELRLERVSRRRLAALPRVVEVQVQPFAHAEIKCQHVEDVDVVGFGDVGVLD